MSEASLTPDEIETLVRLLSKLEPGFMPFPIFHAITRIVATPIIEIVPLRSNSNGETEVLLFRRDNDDPVWPNKLHVPGTVIQASDSSNTFKDAFTRILSSEIGSVTPQQPTFVKSIIHHSGRGREVALVYWVEMVNQPQRGQFFTTKKLPSDLVESQLDFIAAAIKHFNMAKAEA